MKRKSDTTESEFSGRTIWSGAINFGLVNIPVKLYPAITESRLDLDMLDGRDLANIKFKRVNENTGKEVPYQQIVKAYMYHDKYVVLEDADFKSADAEKTQTIDILNFVEEQEIDPIYFEQPYYLAPDKAGMKAYVILRDALQETAKVGVATFVLRNKETLAILKPYGKAIVLNRIRFEDQIRDAGELKFPGEQKLRKAEIDMAIKLVNQLTAKFDISKYHDTYTGKLLKIIAEKAKTGKRNKVPKLRVTYKRNDDELMDMLKASLERKRKAS